MGTRPENPGRRLPGEGAPPAEKEHRELLARALSFVLPSDKAQGAAQSLIRKYGSLTHVLSAPGEELQKSLGGAEKGAGLLRAIGDMVRAVGQERTAGLRRVYDTKSAVQAMHPLFLGQRREVIGLMVLDGRGHVLFNGIVAEGSVSEVPIYVRELVRLCIDFDASTAFLAHNHPSGNPFPSRNDLVATRQVELALRGIHVALLDHIIYTDDSYFSFSDTPMWQDAQDNVQDYFTQQLELAREQEQEYFRSGKNPLP